jgi:hypothetical protein
MVCLAYINWQYFQTFGDHIDTAQSYRTLSQLLLRRRLADASALFANAAVFTLSRIGAPTREAELDLAKARQRQLGNDRKPVEDKPSSDEKEPVNKFITNVTLSLLLMNSIMKVYKLGWTG